jgi:polar amino acid transport system permease protein
VSRAFGWNEFLFLVLALRWTVLLSLIAFVAGGAVGVVVAVLRVQPVAPLRWLAIGFVQLFQGTPVLMQLFVVYYGIAVLLGVQIDPWPAVTLAFTLYTAAFLGDIWRGAIQSIPRGQWEAATALGVRFPVILALVIAPQAFRIAIPPTVGFLVQLIKSTAVAAIIGFVELTRAGQLMTNVTFKPMTVYPIVAGLYFLLCWPLSLLSQRLERRLDARRGLVVAL